MLMIGAPVTFFSLLKKFTDIYIISERNSVGRRLQVKTIITSVITVILAIISGFFIAYILETEIGGFVGYGGLESRPSLQGLIESLMPSSIFEPFETIMPSTNDASSIDIALSIAGRRYSLNFFPRSAEFLFSVVISYPPHQSIQAL